MFEIRGVWASRARRLASPVCTSWSVWTALLLRRLLCSAKHQNNRKSVGDFVVCSAKCSAVHPWWNWSCLTNKKQEKLTKTLKQLESQAPWLPCAAPSWLNLYLDFDSYLLLWKCTIVLKGLLLPKMKILSFITYPMSFQTHKSFVRLRNTI